VTSPALSPTPTQSDIRFLEYRLEVVKEWPESERKVATGAAITCRLLAIAHYAATRPGVDDLLASTCRLLEAHFSADTSDAGAKPQPEAGELLSRVADTPD